MNYRDLNPHLRTALTAHQRTAARQADRWLDERIGAYLRDVERTAFASHSHIRPPRTYDPRFAK